MLHLGYDFKPQDPLRVTEGGHIRQAWSTSQLVADEDFCKVIKDVILLIGKDPKEMTADSRLEDVQFKCGKCPPELSKDTHPAHMFLHFELYGWRKLVRIAFTYLAFLHLLINETRRRNIHSQNITERQACWSLISRLSNRGQRTGKWWMYLQEMVAILLARTVWTPSL